MLTIHDQPKRLDSNNWSERIINHGLDEEQINKLSSNSSNITYILEVSVFNCADEDYSSPDHIIYITNVSELYSSMLSIWNPKNCQFVYKKRFMMY